MHDGFFLPFFPMMSLILVYLLFLGVWIWALIQTIRCDESDGTKIAWVLVLIFVPIVGLIIWLFAGPRAKKA